MLNLVLLLKNLWHTVTSIILIIPLLLTPQVPGGNKDVEDKQALINNIQQNIQIFEEELTSRGTDVVAELNKMINEYKAIGSSENIADIETELSDLIKGYKASTYNADGNPLNIFYSGEVAAVVAFFNANGYKLSAELLVHMKANDVLDSDYTPAHGSRVKQSAVFAKIANSTAISGSDAFPNSGSKEEKDLYYSIHAFSYTKPSAESLTVTIRDRYDYAPGDYSGAAAIAVNEMYKLQENGYLTPYYVNITESL